MANLYRDALHALRRLRHKPEVTTICSLIIALVVGANATVFTFANSILLRPLPYHDADRLIRIWETDGNSNQARSDVSPGSYADWRDLNRTLEQIGAFYAGGSGTTLSGQNGDAIWVSDAYITPSLLSVLDVMPVLGQPFRDGREDPAVLISHGIWRRHFGADPDVVGTSVLLDRREAVILGVMPTDFRLAGDIDVWRPMTFHHRVSLRERGTRYLGVIARLRPDITLTRARADLEHIANQLAADYPSTNKGWGVHLVPLRQSMVNNLRPALFALTGAVGLILLLGCFNISNILMAKGVERQRELAVRVALGSSPLSLIRLLTIESVLLGLLGGALGLCLAIFSVKLFGALIPAAAFPVRITVDGMVLCYTFSLAVFTTVAAGLAPALTAGRRDVSSALRSKRTASERTKIPSFSKILMGAQVALAVVVLIASGLLMKSFVRLLKTDPGFRPQQLQTAAVRLPVDRVTRRIAPNLPESILTQVENIPGVRSAAAITCLPLSNEPLSRFLTLPEEKGTERWAVIFNAVSGKYFSTMEIPLIEGRFFDARDGERSPSVAIINETLARRLGRPGEVIGRTIALGLDGAKSRQIVGVVRDVRSTALDVAPVPEVYVPYSQAPTPFMTVVLRSADELSIAEIRGRIHRIDREISVYNYRSMVEVVAATLPRPRLLAMMMLLFGLMAGVLAAAGVYGVVGVSTSRRRREIGVRLALGARPLSVVRMVISDTVKNVLVGIALGLLGTVALARLLDSLLFEVKPFDETTFVFVALVMTATAVLAAAVPACRAVRVDAATTLRSD